MKPFPPQFFRSLAVLQVLLALNAGATERAPSVAPVDAPQLAGLGAWPVGVRTIELVDPGQPDLPLMARTAGKQFISERALEVHVWYPALASNAAPASYAARLPSHAAGKAGAAFEVAGVARRDAAPVNGGKYPLVVISHGFGGWGTFMSYLAEGLASRGYIVAAIDHADQPFVDAGGFAMSFGSVMLHRSRDQQFVIDTLMRRALDPADPIGVITDPKSVGLVGYSMGGFGALATAGARYDKNSLSFKGMPPPAMAQLAGDDTQSTGKGSVRLGALVLIAPWGAQPANRAWTPASLAVVRVPTLLIAGDQDDIVDYKDGVSWLFAGLTGTSRHLLVYQNARHNIGGNPAPAAAASDFSATEYFEEPAWRKDRIMAINQHFIAAFLDRNLKGDAGMAAFLDLAPVRANEARWPLPFGRSSGPALATGSGESKEYWPGFQRRWAVGLEMHQRGPGK